MAFHRDSSPAGFACHVLSDPADFGNTHRLAAVNFLLFCVGGTQVTRVLLHQRSQKNEGMGEQVKDAVKDEARVVKGVAEDPKGAAKKVSGGS